MILTLPIRATLSAQLLHVQRRNGVQRVKGSPLVGRHAPAGKFVHAPKMSFQVFVPVAVEKSFLKKTQNYKPIKRTYNIIFKVSKCLTNE